MNVGRRFRGILAVGLLLAIVSTATARYSGGTGEPNDPYQIATAADLIALGCDPNQWGPLAPPSGHWVFNEPISVQTKLVTIEVTALDADNEPVGYTQVLAYCQPWDFTHWEWTDGSGCCRIVGPIGDYHFYASSGQILAVSERITVSKDINVSLTGTSLVQIAFVNPGGSSFVPRGQGPWWCWFTPTSLPSASGTYHAGYLQEGKALRWTTSDVNGVLALMHAPEEQTPGYIVFQNFSSKGSNTYVVDEQGLGCVRFRLDGLPAGATWYSFSLDPIGSEIGYHMVNKERVPSTGGTHEVRVTPGLYRVYTPICLHQSDGSIAYGGAWVPVILNVEPNSVHELHLGGTFEARFNVMRGDPGYVHLWVDIVDNLGNYLADVRGAANLRLSRGGEVLFDGPITSANGRYIGFGNPLADDMRLGAPVEYEYQFSSPVLGRLTASGILSPDRQIHRDAQLVAQSSHFTLHSRHPAPYADEVLQILECAYDWLVSEYSGPFSPQSMERFDVLYGTAGGGGSSGDQFGTDLYSGYYMTGDADQMGLFYHEFVHGCIASLLSELQKQGLIVRPGIFELSEPEANFVGAYLVRAVHGERAFRMCRQQWNTAFFNCLAGASGSISEIERHQFPMFYIDARYGQVVNREFFRAMYTNERNLGAILETMDFLKTESERTATLYSYLANDNLAWLYRWAGFQVSDEIVDQGVAYIKTQVGM